MQLETQKLWKIEEQIVPTIFKKRKKVSILKIVNHGPFNVSEPILIRLRTLDFQHCTGLNTTTALLYRWLQHFVSADLENKKYARAL